MGGFSSATNQMLLRQASMRAAVLAVESGLSALNPLLGLCTNRPLSGGFGSLVGLDSASLRVYRLFILDYFLANVLTRGSIDGLACALWAEQLSVLLSAPLRSVVLALRPVLRTGCSLPTLDKLGIGVSDLLLDVGVSFHSLSTPTSLGFEEGGRLKLSGLVRALLGSDSVDMLVPLANQLVRTALSLQVLPDSVANDGPTVRGTVSEGVLLLGFAVADLGSVSPAAHSYLNQLLVRVADTSASAAKRSRYLGEFRHFVAENQS